MTQQEYNQLQKQLAQQGHTIKLVNGKVTDSTGKPLFKDKESGNWFVYDKIGNRLYFTDNGKFIKNEHIKPSKGFFKNIEDKLKTFASKMGEVNPNSANAFIPYQSQGIRTTAQKASGIAYQKTNGTYATPSKEQQIQAQHELNMSPFIIGTTAATAGAVSSMGVVPFLTEMEKDLVVGLTADQGMKYITKGNVQTFGEGMRNLIRNTTGFQGFDNNTQLGRFGNSFYNFGTDAVTPGYKNLVKLIALGKPQPSWAQRMRDREGILFSSIIPIPSKSLTSPVTLKREVPLSEWGFGKTGSRGSVERPVLDRRLQEDQTLQKAYEIILSEPSQKGLTVISDPLVPITEDAKLAALYYNLTAEKPKFAWDFGYVGSSPVKGTYRSSGKFSKHASTSDSQLASTFKYGSRDLDASEQYLRSLGLSKESEAYGLSLIAQLRSLRNSLGKVKQDVTDLSPEAKKYIELNDALNTFLSDGFQHGANAQQVIMQTPRNRLAIGQAKNLDKNIGFAQETEGDIVLFPYAGNIDLSRQVLTNTRSKQGFGNILNIEALTKPGKALDNRGFDFIRIFGSNPYLMTTQSGDLITPLFRKGGVFK